ncbi:hypothetical protein IJ847_02290 [Candidatus Saccharibacteria bacterium]|nr:hypothetical protein [Candidatus Saccharibacteria bacterium]
MQLSTRKLRTRSIFAILTPVALIFIASFIVSNITKQEAQAERTTASNFIFYANTTEYTAETGLAKAREIFGNENVTNCGTVTENSPYTGQATQYYLFADQSLNCSQASSAASGSHKLLNDNGATVLTSTFEDSFLAQRYANNGLGALGAFHVVAFDTLYSGVQSYGNVAASTLNAFGNNNIQYFPAITLSYIKHMQGKPGSINGKIINNKSSVLVVGEDTRIGVGDNGARWGLYDDNNSLIKIDGQESYRIYNGEYLDNVWQESSLANVEFLNFDTLKQQAKTLNQRLASYQQDANVTDYNLDSTGNNQNFNYIRVSNIDKLNIIDVDPSVFTYDTVAQIVGFNENTPASLLINLDMNGKTDENNKFVFNKKIDLCYLESNLKYTDADAFDGISPHLSNQSNHEASVKGENNAETLSCINHKWTHDLFENHVILNFYDSSEPDGQFHGEISFAHGSLTAFTIAPSATVSVDNTDYQGIIIANNVNQNHDTYYLSVANFVPFSTENEQPTCKITIVHKHISGAFAPFYEYTDKEEPCGTSHTVNVYSGFSSYKFVNIEYAGAEATSYTMPGHPYNTYTLANGAKTTNRPLTVLNDLESGKTFTVWYDDIRICAVTVNHYKLGTTEPVDESIVHGTVTSNFNNDDQCGGTVTVNISNKAIQDGYIYVSGKVLNGNTSEQNKILTSADTSYSTENDMPNKTINFYYVTPDDPNPDICHLVVHHYKLGTTEKLADDEVHDDRCDRDGAYTKTISGIATNKGYDFVSGKYLGPTTTVVFNNGYDNERDASLQNNGTFTGDDTPIYILNDSTNTKTLIFYYSNEEQTEEPKENPTEEPNLVPENPNTVDFAPIAAAILGSAGVLGAVVLAANRRRR